MSSPRGDVAQGFILMISMTSEFFGINYRAHSLHLHICSSRSSKFDSFCQTSLWPGCDSLWSQDGSKPHFFANGFI